MISRKKPLALACALALGVAGTAQADDMSDMRAMVQTLQQQVKDLQSQLGTVSTQVKQQEVKVDKVEKVAASSSSSGISLVPGDELKFMVGNTTIQFYGHADLSMDSMTNGLKNAHVSPGGPTASGNNSWLADIASNNSSFGIRGAHPINDDLSAIFQLEADVVYASTTGASDIAPDATAQKGQLGSRNSFLGLKSTKYGAIMLGKTDTPYKSSTGKMDPFANTIGDYNAIMGNTGGDSRVEFDQRLSHSIWYQSPNLSGWSFSGLISPGQNRSTDTELYALGEPDCTAGNSINSPSGSNPSNGSVCNDGSFGTAYSASLAYKQGAFNAIAAYELHKNVNRIGDEDTGQAGMVGIRNESAYKLGGTYAFNTGTTVNFIYERLERDAITSGLNERTRSGTWLALTQKLTANDALNFGWAHAFRTPGQPTNGVVDMNGNGTVIGQNDNSANLYDLSWVHNLDKKTSMYLVYSRLVNGPTAHYALGAGGHGIVTRNYEGDKYNGGCAGDCSLVGGYTAQGVSIGMTYDF